MCRDIKLSSDAKLNIWVENVNFVKELLIKEQQIVDKKSIKVVKLKYFLVKDEICMP